MDIAETERYQLLNPELPAAEVRDIAATYSDFQEDDVEEDFVDSPEDLLDFFDAVKVHESSEDIDGAAHDSLLLESQYQIDAACWASASVYNTFAAEQEVAAIGPAANDLDTDFDFNKSLNDLF